MAAHGFFNLLLSPSTPSTSVSVSRSSLSGKPRPGDFEMFIPWICLEMQSPVTVTVTKIIQEDYVRPHQRRQSSKSNKSVKSVKSAKTPRSSTYEEKTKTAIEKSPIIKYSETVHRSGFSVPIIAYYDVRGNLVEICVVDSPLAIHKKVIQAINVCLPFHSLLCKLTIRKVGLTPVILHELSKLLPHSNLTNICLDDTKAPQLNYNVLLANTSQLKSLSLNRCSINDLVCTQLAESIDFGNPGCNLLTLELGSNQISDLGAQAFGDVLRRNRHLLHLNLSGNMITDIGAMSIFIHLMDFPLTYDEITETRLCKVKYYQNKAEVYARCLKEVISKSRTIVKNPLGRAKKSPKSLTGRFPLGDSNDIAAEKMASEIVGIFSDPFSSDYAVTRNGYCYCSGNMFLCSLNLAYNNLQYPSIKNIHEVLKYQRDLVKPPGATGLLRVGIDGNHIPKYCVDYEEISILLGNAIFDLYHKRLELLSSANNKHNEKKRISMR